jgi:hypothetical protein
VRHAPSAPARPRGRAVAALALLLAGGVSGIATLALHTRDWGLPLAAAAGVTAVLALPPGWWSRLALAVGWSLPVGLAVAGRLEGDHVLSETASGYAVLVMVLVLLGMAVGTLGAISGPVRSGT